MASNVGLIVDDRYLIKRMVARTGHSTVYRAHDIRDDTRVAIKLLDDPTDGDRKRLRRSFQLHRSVSHPNIVKVFDLLDEPTRTGIVMEYVPGVDLQRFWWGLPSACVIDQAERWHWLEPRSSAACWTQSRRFMRPESCTAT